MLYLPTSHSTNVPLNKPRPIQQTIQQSHSTCDAYDALTAADRPYKQVLSPDLDLEILETEAKEGSLDHELVRMFAESKVWSLTVGMRPGA